MPHGAHHHAKAAGTFAFAVAAINNQNTGFALRQLDFLIHQLFFALHATIVTSIDIVCDCNSYVFNFCHIRFYIISF